MNDGNAFHEDREFVLSNLQDGNLDHVEGVSRVVETPFFQKFIGDGDLAKLAATYPTPRQKEEKKLTPAEQKSCRFRRYYQLVSLSHTSRKSDFLLYSGSRVVRTGGEVQQLVPLVEDFVSSVGRGVMKLLILDRGLIDGKSIGTIKEKHGVDVLIPLKAKMDITTDAWRLSEVD